MSIEHTFVIIKGDAVTRGLIGRILSRFEDKGLMVTNMRMLSMTADQVCSLYDEHKGKEYFNRLLSFSVGVPVVAMTLMGNSAISVVRKIIGATNCCEAEPGTIRGDFGISSSNRTLVHASRTAADVKRESAIFFDDSWLHPHAYRRCDWDAAREPEVEF